MKRGGQFAVVVFLVLLILAMAEAQFHFLRGLPGRQPLGQRELATQFLGQYLAAHYPGKKAIVLSNPFVNLPGQPREVYRFEQAGLRGLRRGLGSAVADQVVFPELKPGCLQNPRAVFIDPRTTTPLSYLVADDALDKLAGQHPEAELVVSLIGLPLNIRHSQCWKTENRCKFGLLLPDLRMVGEQAAIRQALQRQKIVGMVLNKPGAPPEDQALGRDAKMEFDQRFLLVTPENVDQCLRLYPRLF